MRVSLFSPRSCAAQVRAEHLNCRTVGSNRKAQGGLLEPEFEIRHQAVPLRACKLANTHKIQNWTSTTIAAPPWERSRQVVIKNNKFKLPPLREIEWNNILIGKGMLIQTHSELAPTILSCETGHILFIFGFVNQTLTL